MASVTQYLPTAIVMTIDGQQVTDYAEDSFITVTPVESIGGVKYGADGGATAYGSAIRGVTVKIALRQNSAGAAMVDKKMRSQLSKITNGQKMTLLPVSIYDSISKSTTRGDGIFTTAPEKGYGKEPGTREYTLELPAGLSNSSELAG